MYDNALMASTYAQSARANFLKLSRAVQDAGAAATMADLDQAVAAITSAERAFREDLDVVRERALGAQAHAIVDQIRALADHRVGQRATVVEAARQRVSGGVAELAHWSNAFLDNLHDTVAQVRAAADQVAAAAGAVAAGSQQLSLGGQQQAASLRRRRHPWIR